jgi:predicted RNA-binding protein
VAGEARSNALGSPREGQNRNFSQVLNMCQATVYLGDREVARELIRLEPAEDGVRLAALFEESKIIPGRIRHVDFLKHRVLLEPLEEREDGRGRSQTGQQR